MFNFSRKSQYLKQFVLYIARQYQCSPYIYIILWYIYIYLSSNSPCVTKQRLLPNKFSFPRRSSLVHSFATFNKSLVNVLLFFWGRYGKDVYQIFTFSLASDYIYDKSFCPSGVKTLLYISHTTAPFRVCRHYTMIHIIPWPELCLLLMSLIWTVRHNVERKGSCVKKTGGSTVQMCWSVASQSL